MSQRAVKAEIDPETQKNVDSWLSGSYDEASKAEVRRLQRENPEALLDAFYKHLSFGTGGMRGEMGVGTNRMNLYTVRAASQGLANYLLKQDIKNPSILINYDCRNHSKEFAEEAAKVFAANGISVLLFDAIRPVALTSFGILHLHCSCGVMITASHNPLQYNGYKVWWSDACQVLPPHDSGIIAQVDAISDPAQVKVADLTSPLIKSVGREVDAAYIEALSHYPLHPAENKTKGKNLKIVYTSLHGNGIHTVPPVLTDWGFTNITLVDEQCRIDGNFPTTPSPNPEEPAALALGIEKLKAVNGDILFATDPDADRLGIVVMHKGTPVLLNGNESVCIALEHICRALKEAKNMPTKPMCIKTIVTTELFRAITEHYQISCLDVLTGFKYIGEKIAQWEEDKAVDVAAHHYIFGGEESYGALYGTHARDKDAPVFAAILAEAASHLKVQGKTLIDFLHEIYHKYGVYREKLLSLTFEGKEGADKMHEMMTRLRQNPPKTIGSSAVTCIEDYLTHTAYFPESGTKEPLILPKSNVIRITLADHTRLVVRPSGTEPKIKIYCSTFSKHFITDPAALTKCIATCDQRADETLRKVKKLLSS